MYERFNNLKCMFISLATMLFLASVNGKNDFKIKSQSTTLNFI